MCVWEENALLVHDSLRTNCCIHSFFIRLVSFSPRLEYSYFFPYFSDLRLTHPCFIIISILCFIWDRLVSSNTFSSFSKNICTKSQPPYSLKRILIKRKVCTLSAQQYHEYYAYYLLRILMYRLSVRISPLRSREFPKFRKNYNLKVKL